jgi:hypothetical protein
MVKLKEVVSLSRIFSQTGLFAEFRGGGGGSAQRHILCFNEPKRWARTELGERGAAVICPSKVYMEKSLLAHTKTIDLHFSSHAEI